MPHPAPPTPPPHPPGRAWPRAVSRFGRAPTAATTELDLAGVTLHIGRTPPLAEVGAVPGDAVWLLLPFTGGLRVRGAALGPHDFAALGAGAEYELASAKPTDWALVSLPLEAAEALLPQPARSPLRHPAGAAIITADAGAWRCTARLLHEVAAVQATTPEIFALREARVGAREEVLEACGRLLDVPAGRRLRGATSGQRRILRAAEACILARPAEITSPERLAAALGIPAARVQAAFLAVLGTTVARYLIRRRLMLVLAALGSAPLEATARAHGFRSAEQLGRAYAALFGSPPLLDCATVAEGGWPNISR